MNKQNDRMLSDEQLDNISGGCFIPSVVYRAYEDYKKNYCKPDYSPCDRDYDKYDHCDHHRPRCD